MSRKRGARRAGIVAIGAVLAVAASGCGSSSGSKSPAPGESRPTASRSHPVGIVAIGHSGLTGENSDPDRPRQPALENSWATGTSPKVDSVYLRLVAARPETKSHVFNSAMGGAPVTALAAQAETALTAVKAPELIIVSTIDNDIQCDGTDADNVGKFGATLAGVLKSLSASSPDSKILLVGQLGRPSIAYVTGLVAEDPSARDILSGPGICDFYNRRGELNKASFTTLTKIINGYEDEQARVCAGIANCRTDGGVRAAYIDRFANFSDDLAHLNVRGQAYEAKLIWPVVARFLGLS